MEINALKKKTATLKNMLISNPRNYQKDQER